MKREISAGAVIFRKEKNRTFYLALQYNPKYWGLAKGHIEEKESTDSAILREVEEETGLKDLEFIPGFKETEKYIFVWPPGKKTQEKVFKIVVYRLAETKTKKIKISEEHIGYDWLEYPQALQKMTYKSAKSILKKADEFLRKSVSNGAKDS